MALHVGGDVDDQRVEFDDHVFGVAGIRVGVDEIAEIEGRIGTGIGVGDDDVVGVEHGGRA